MLDYLKSTSSGLLKALGLLVLLGVLVAGALSATPMRPSSLQPSDVKLVGDKGHGSAVHIGGGFYLTAGHVASMPTKKFSIKTHDGLEREATVMWISKEYDIALVQASDFGIEDAQLSCREPKVGEEVVLKGNPTLFEFLTSYGRVSGESRKLALWHDVVMIDSTILPGQSGGPMFDVKGKLIGITVGVATWGAGFMSAPTGYGMAVPGDTLCGLLGRSA